MLTTSLRTPRALSGVASEANSAGAVAGSLPKTGAGNQVSRTVPSFSPPLIKVAIPYPAARCDIRQA